MIIVSTRLKPNSKVLVMFDEARSAAQAPYYLSDPSNGDPLINSSTAKIAKWRYEQEAIDAAQGVKLIPVVCAGLRGSDWISAVAEAHEYNTGISYFQIDIEHCESESSESFSGDDSNTDLIDLMGD